MQCSEHVVMKLAVKQVVSVCEESLLDSDCLLCEQ